MREGRNEGKGGEKEGEKGMNRLNIWGAFLGEGKIIVRSKGGKEGGRRGESREGEG